MKKYMFIDLHVHERTYSKDSKICLKEIVEAAASKGLKGICITDHDSLEICAFAEGYSREVKFPIFVGVEVYTTEGDIIAFGIDKMPGRRPTAQEFIDYVKNKGGVCFSAHPYRDNGRGLGNLLFDVSGLDGVEVLNGNTSLEDNRRALAACSHLGLQPLGASDAHTKEVLGRYATYIPDDIRTMKELIAALQSGKCRPAIWEQNGYRIADNF